MPQVERPLLRAFHNSRDGLLKSPSRAAPMRIATCATQAHHQGEQYKPHCSFHSLSLRHGCAQPVAQSASDFAWPSAQLAPDRIRLLIYFAVRRALAGKRDRSSPVGPHSFSLPPTHASGVLWCRVRCPASVTVPELVLEKVVFVWVGIRRRDLFRHIETLLVKLIPGRRRLGLYGGAVQRLTRIFALEDRPTEILETERVNRVDCVVF